MVTSMSSSGAQRARHTRRGTWLKSSFPFQKKTSIEGGGGEPSTSFTPHPQKGRRKMVERQSTAFKLLSGCLQPAPAIQRQPMWCDYCSDHMRYPTPHRCEPRLKEIPVLCSPVDQMFWIRLQFHPGNLILLYWVSDVLEVKIYLYSNPSNFYVYIKHQ